MAPGAAGSKPSHLCTLGSSNARGGQVSQGLWGHNAYDGDVSLASISFSFFIAAKNNFFDLFLCQKPNNTMEVINIITRTSPIFYVVSRLIFFFS